MPQQIQPDSKVLDAKKKSQVAMSMSLVEGLYGVTCFGLKNESYLVAALRNFSGEERYPSARWAKC